MDNNLGRVVLVKDINSFTYSSGGDSIGFNPEFTEFNGRLYFRANDGVSGDELFVTDGTSAGTNLVKDINPGSGDSIAFFYAGFTEFNGKLYFIADNGTSGDELFVTDGTSEGTNLVKDINPGGSSSLRFYAGFTEFNGKLYFSANDGTSGNELFVTDGTANGTRLVADINPGSNSSLSNFIRGFTEFNGRLYFSANDGTSGDELYVTDGTAEGTRLVADINPGSDGSDPGNFTILNGELYFAARDESSTENVYVTDGTAEGTTIAENVDVSQLQASLNFGASESQSAQLNGREYIVDFEPETGFELFVTDGTAEGSQLVADINPGSSGSFPRNTTTFNERVYFTADDGTFGDELYVTDGTDDGTLLVKDVYPSSYSYTDPNNLTVLNDELFFSANDDRFGRELFKLTFDSSVTQSLNSITGTPNNDNIIGTELDDNVVGDEGNDSLTGERGNDFLDGGAGNDILYGGVGDDTFDGGLGTDTAIYQFVTAGITLTLDEGTTLGTASDGLGGTDSLANLENVIGSEFDDNITGNSDNNSLTGRRGNDTIAGGQGDDFITGSLGADILTGGAGSDRFIYLNAGQGADTITDFAVGTDKITVVAAAFGGGLSAGDFLDDSFVYANAAITSSQRFLFDVRNGELFFDVDGSGSSPQQLIATVQRGAQLSAGDIMLI